MVTNVTVHTWWQEKYIIVVKCERTLWYKGRCYICSRLVTSEQYALKAVAKYSDGLHDILVLLIMYQLVHKRTRFPAQAPIKYPSPYCTRYFREVLVDLVWEKWNITVVDPGFSKGIFPIFQDFPKGLHQLINLFCQIFRKWEIDIIF